MEKEGSMAASAPQTSIPMIDGAAVERESSDSTDTSPSMLGAKQEGGSLSAEGFQKESLFTFADKVGLGEREKTSTLMQEREDRRSIDTGDNASNLLSVPSFMQGEHEGALEQTTTGRQHDLEGKQGRSAGTETAREGTIEHPTGERMTSAIKLSVSEGRDVLEVERSEREAQTFFDGECESDAIAKDLSGNDAIELPQTQQSGNESSTAKGREDDEDEMENEEEEEPDEEEPQEEAEETCVGEDASIRSGSDVEAVGDDDNLREARLDAREEGEDSDEERGGRE
eukprot:1447860-Rhodomonas_salina.3